MFRPFRFDNIRLMNVLDEKKITDEVINPALDRLHGEIIPALRTALDASVSTALENAAATGKLLITELANEADKLLQMSKGDIADVLNSLDGWTLEISVRLTKPKVKGVE